MHALLESGVVPADALEQIQPPSVVLLVQVHHGAVVQVVAVLGLFLDQQFEEGKRFLQVAPLVVLLGLVELLKLLDIGQVGGWRRHGVPNLWRLIRNPNMRRLIGVLGQTARRDLAGGDLVLARPNFEHVG